MNKAKIEQVELNKLYDEIYYTSLDGVEQALELISNIIAEKEFEDSGVDISSFSDILDTIMNVLDETADVMDNEELYDVSSYIREKVDKIHTGELDDVIENSYLNNIDDEDYDDYDDYDDEDIYDSDDDDYDDEY